MNRNESSNIWLFLEVLGRRRNFIFIFVLIITLLSVVVSMLLPKRFTAKALLLPPKNVSVALGDLGQAAESYAVATGLNLPLMATPTDVYARMLKSRSVAQRVIERFELKKYYHAGSFEETYDALFAFTSVTVSEEGLLEVKVTDRDPKQAADIANAFIEELDNVNKDIIQQRIEQTRNFISGRLEQVVTELDSARSALEVFQYTHKTVDFDEQTRLAIEQAAQLKITLAEIELQVQMKELTLGQENSELRSLKKQQTIVKNQLRNLENDNTDSSFFSLPVASIPALKGQYEVLYSKVRVAEALYKVLLQQQEQNKLREYEKMPTISVLDRAQVPETKSWPQRSLIVMGSFAVALILAILWALFIEYLYKLKEAAPEDYKRAVAFLRAYFGWLPAIRKLK